MAIRISSGVTLGMAVRSFTSCFICFILVGEMALDLKHNARVWLTLVSATLGPTHHVYFHFISHLFALLLIFEACTDISFFRDCMIHSLPFRIFPTVEILLISCNVCHFQCIVCTSVWVTVTHFCKIVILKHFGNQTPSKKEKHNGMN